MATAIEPRMDTLHTNDEADAWSGGVSRRVKISGRHGFVFPRGYSWSRHGATLFASIAILISGLVEAAEAEVVFSGEKKLNNLVSALLEVSSIALSSKPHAFRRSNDGWVLITSKGKGTGTVRIMLDKEPVIVQDGEGGREAMRYVTGGEHTVQVEAKAAISVEKLVVKAIPELIHCGLGFNPEIKSYGPYDMDFLKPEILPNVTTLIVPNAIKISESLIADWHRQGKRFVAEAGVNAQAKTPEEHFKSTNNRTSITMSGWTSR